MRSEPSSPRVEGPNFKHHEPGSWPTSICCAQPLSETEGAEHPVEEGTTAMRKPTATRRATGPGKGRRTNAEPGGTLERHAAAHNQGKRQGAKQHSHRVLQTWEACRTPRRTPKAGNAHLSMEGASKQ